MMPVKMAMTPSASPMASEALMMRFMATCRNCAGSASMAGRSSASTQRSRAFLETETCSRCVSS